MTTFESMRADIVEELDTLKNSEVQIPTVINDVAVVIATVAGVSVET
jgi:hypothetical protein